MEIKGYRIVQQLNFACMNILYLHEYTLLPD